MKVFHIPSKAFILIHLLVSGLNGFANNITCRITGSINLKSGNISLSYFSDIDTPFRDTAQIINGSFSFVAKANAKTMANIILLNEDESEECSNECRIVLKDGDLNIKLQVCKFGNRIIHPSEEQLPQLAIEKIKRDWYREFQNRLLAIDEFKNYFGENEYQQITENMLENLKQSTIDAYSHGLNALIKNFIKTNNHSIVAIDQLEDFLFEMPRDTIWALLKIIQPQLLTNHSGVFLRKYLTRWPTNPAPDFSAKDINGHDLSLFNLLEGNYVLLDFWASWCGPCRADNPTLRKLYAKYRDSGFEIVGISRDDKEVEAWKMAIDKDSIGHWRHINELAWHKSAINQLYAVQPIPVKILIDKQRNIIYRRESSGTGELEALLVRIFGF